MTIDTDIEIDVIKKSDYHAVLSLFAYLGENYTCAPEDAKTQAVFDLYVVGQQKRGFVARAEGNVCGVILFDVTPLLGRGFLQLRGDGLAVDPAYRKRGIGSALLERVFSECAKLGAANYLVKASQPRVIEQYRKLAGLVERGVYFYHTPNQESNA